MLPKSAYVVMCETFSKHGNSYEPCRVFLSEMEAGKWLQDQPKWVGNVEYEYDIVEVPLG